MSPLPKKPFLQRDETYYRLKGMAEDFLFEEAELLDLRRFLEWTDLLSDDLVYFMPIKRNVKYDEQTLREKTREGSDINWFEEDKWTLTKRAEQIMTGVHWAEEPLSRVCHIVSNIQLIDSRPSKEGAKELDLRSRFLIYQNRVEQEAYFFVGKRSDTLRLEFGQWRLLRREIELDQNVLLAKNLTVFF